MKEKIKNTTILGKTVRPDKAQMLKQVQHDMEVVQDDMVRVQGDMWWLRCLFGALAPEKNFSLLTFHFSPSHFSRKFGFTLAEVLITLGIIGVVAAMTMPTLIAKYQKKVFATKVKQTYAILSNALTSSIAANGTPAEWSYGASSDEASPGSEEELTYIANTYFKPYLKVAEDIGYKNRGYHIVLSNGTTLSFYTDGSTTNGIYTPYMIYIIASNNKNTQVSGSPSRDYSRHDIFFSVGNSSKSLDFFCWGRDNLGCGGYSNREDIIDNTKYGCNENIARNLRYNCGALIMSDGWEIKDDYPW